MSGGPSPRDAVLGRVRAALGVDGREAGRQALVAERLSVHRTGVVPARGQLPPAERIDLYENRLKGVMATVERLPDAAAVPAAVAAVLRDRNLPAAIRIGDDPRLAAMPWGAVPTLAVGRGRSFGDDLAAVSHAFAAVAETGTTLLVSGPDNPTTLNFLPDLHIVVVNAADVAGDFETVIARLRDRYGAGQMPRTVNMVTGPSRSADIEQTLVLGAHGPRALHVLIVG
jgi:L-lactate dehydrogenase complex protein LldG